MEIDANIAARLSEVRARIAAAARSGRDPSSVRLLAVTKTVPTAIIHSAAAAGQTLFGKNYVQEAKAEAAELPGAELHLIGHLQRNKAKDAVKIFSLIHTVDTPQLAEALDAAAAKNEKKQDILIQVNVSCEGTKSGAAPRDVLTLANAVESLEHLRLRGLMCIGSYIESSEPEELRRKELRALRELRDQLARALGRELPELSMGMSHDYEAAVEEGATIVRIGSAIFGART